MPKTPGNDDAFKVYDPARVSHIPVSQSVRHPSGVAGSLATPDPRVVGATPHDPGLKSGHPCRGASFTTLYNELNGFCTTQMRQPCQTEWDKVHQDLFPQSETLRTSVRGLQREPYNRLVFNIQLPTVPSTGISVHYSDYTLD